MSVAIEEIQTILSEILVAHPAGVDEYALLKEMASRDVGLFNEEYFHSSFGLFQRHFLLFHALYLLRENLRSTGQGDLEIHCMGIRRLLCSNTPSEYPAVHEPLAVYYLDLDNLKNTDEADVLNLLGNFWKKYTSTEQRDEALAVLELTHTASYPDIKQQYRRLAMQWHPDRGGDTEQFHRLEWAMRILRAVYQ
jgi:hypothetical protein